MYNDYCALVDEFNKFANLATREVAKINEKGDLTPNEVESVYKIACIAEKAFEMAEQFEEEGNSQYMPEDVYGYERMRGNSYRRGRSAVTGRYVSRDGAYVRNGGYSGHSIEDRMIAALEQQMDHAAGDYERQKIQEQINHIRMGTN